MIQIMTKLKEMLKKHRLWIKLAFCSWFGSFLYPCAIIPIPEGYRPQISFSLDDEWNFEKSEDQTGVLNSWSLKSHVTGYLESRI